MNPSTYAMDFNSWFPGFVESCVRLHDLLIPFSMGLLVLAFTFSFWNGQTNPIDMFRFLIKLFLVVLVITHAHSLLNDGQIIIQDFVDQNIPARPENIAELYKAKLAEAQNAPELQDQSFSSLLFSANFFEALVLAAMTLISWLAVAVLFFVFIVQKSALLLCWCLSPPLFALFAIRPLAYLAFRHLMRIVGILLWPLGIALASTITEGLIANQTRDSFLDDIQTFGVTGWALQQVLALTVIAIWILFSSLAAPFFIQRLVSGSTGPAGLLTRAGESLVNLGVPTMAGLLVSARRDSALPNGSSGPGKSGPSLPVPAMPWDTPPPPATELAQHFAPDEGPTDPTARRKVEEVLADPQQPV